MLLVCLAAYTNLGPGVALEVQVALQPAMTGRRWWVRAGQGQGPAELQRIPVGSTAGCMLVACSPALDAAALTECMAAAHTPPLSSPPPPPGWP